LDCRDVQNLLHPYSDGELDLVRQLQIEHHLAECVACAERLRALRQLRDAIAAAALFHRAPNGLRARLQTAPATPAPQRHKRRVLVLAVTAAGIVLVLASCLTAGIVWARATALADQATALAENRVAEQVIASHVRSLQVTHLLDKPSSDRHVVKPWFQDKLDFSPQVPDLRAHDYILAGGRLDYLTNRPVAALIYKCRSHVINVFIWPTESEQPVRALQKQGFQLRSWQRAGMAYWVISDLNGEELDQFVRLLGEGAS
jgi:anti-sigma factor RsiW